MGRWNGDTENQHTNKHNNKGARQERVHTSKTPTKITPTLRDARLKMSGGKDL